MDNKLGPFYSERPGTSISLVCAVSIDIRTIARGEETTFAGPGCSGLVAVAILKMEEDVIRMRWAFDPLRAGTGQRCNVHNDLGLDLVGLKWHWH